MSHLFHFARLIALSVALPVLFAACSPRVDGPESKPDVRAPEKIADSFHAVPSAQLGSAPEIASDKFKVSIARSALEKEFLLQGALIPQTTAASGKSLKSRVVAFRERDGKLYLVEATAGHVVTADLPAAILLAEFPIIESTAERIVFDFNLGMASLYKYSDWHASDIEGGGYNSGTQFTTIKVSKSYLESVATTGENQLVLRQIAQLTMSTPAGEATMPVEARYYLTPYRPTQGYQPFRSSLDFSRYGYFQIAPQYTPASTSIVYATRWNPAKKIVFAVSANTPSEYKQAVKDGILYWNKIFGRDMLEAVDGAAGATAPDFSQNIVQWVPYDRAGSAYADAQADPRTGEIMHAQVFLTSAFAFGGKNRARMLARSLKAGAPYSLNRIPGFGIQLTGFENDQLCDFAINEQTLTGISNMLAQPEIDDAGILKVAQDYIREVVAHEIGHTLGLRHNFAGSLSANYPLDKREGLVTEYFTKRTAPIGIVTSSSVMEYQRFEESIFTGDQMTKKTVAPLEYDKKAIATLYLDAKFKNDEWPLFCTDSSESKFADCKIFDIGTSIAETAAFQTADDLKQMPASILERYILAKTPSEGEELVPVEQVMLPTPATVAAAVLAPRQAVVQQLTSEGGLLKVMRLFPVSGPFNEDVVRKAHFNYLTGQIERFGGFESLLAPVSVGFAATSMARLNMLLEKEAYQRGKGSDDQAYAFTDQEIGTIRANAGIYFSKLEKELQKQELAILAGGEKAKFQDEPLNDKYSAFVGARMQQLIMTLNGESIFADIEVPNSVTTTGAPKTVVRSVRLPKFLYSTELRVKAASLLKGARGEAVAWGVADKAAVQGELAALIESVLSVPLEKMKIEKLPRAVVAWLAEQKAVMAAF